MARYDGRAADELREVKITPNFTDNPAGSVLCQVGNTMVLCTVCEEDGVPRWRQGTGYLCLLGAHRRRRRRRRRSYRHGPAVERI